MFIVEPYFGAKNEPGRAWEVFKKLPGGGALHSDRFGEYGPVASHGDPIHYPPTLATVERVGANTPSHHQSPTLRYS